MEKWTHTHTRSELHNTMMFKYHLIFVTFLVFLLIYHYRRALSNQQRKHTPTRPKKTRRIEILALGDSLTQGLYNWPVSTMFHPYTIKVQELFDMNHGEHFIEVLNGGESGDKVRKIKTRLHNYLVNGTLNFVIILAGTNDYIKVIKDTRAPGASLPNIPETSMRIFHSIMLLHEACHLRNISTGVITIPEIKFERSDRLNLFKPIRQAINTLLKDYVERKKTKTILIDLANHLEKLTSLAQEDARIWDDGIHMTPYGYDKMGEFIFDSIASYVTTLGK